MNFGGGHLMTRKDYDTRRLITLMRDFRNRYPNIHVILEPGSALPDGRRGRSWLR